MEVIRVKNDIGIPKYQQIIRSIESAILAKELVKGDKLPSINNVKHKFSLSRDTVLLAFNDLKTRGIIQSIPGKGYYVAKTTLDVTRRVFLLFDELNAFKEDLYNSFLQNIEDNVEVDIYFHHFNKKLFSKLINDSLGNYSYYIIMPANFKEIADVIQLLPHDKVFIVDQLSEELSDYPSVYQNFKKDMYFGLEKLSKQLKRYQQLKLVFDPKKQPLGMLEGFELFCKGFGLHYSHYNSVEEAKLSYKDAVLVLDDKDLIEAVKIAKIGSLNIGQDLGIISYNEAPLKEVVANGITTFSTDFKHMGKTMAEMIMRNQRMQIENRNIVINRNSL
ncbi:substrate-binding protein-like domain-containing protein [Zhouia amylolytica]|uniref:Substrate-binding protein-like domain-containing protein n=2 Tax=Zhouia amylolytica TaxID=376730 RepID=A0A1I6QN26_9FLAO|nr:GntR family transcriptional regulator [Zhouia amylolytica]ETN95891.1 putative transcriptional regulator [Zhouia amylolytica AD3]MCQ0111983.1 GntR family transcriptional regulator [Zhouia amylolytica]SFS53867.1 substrate-binding protein-like domain-containing protein [Zhouia amylolytica]